MTCEVETLMVLSYKYQDIKLQIPVGQLPVVVYALKLIFVVFIKFIKSTFTSEIYVLFLY